MKTLKGAQTPELRTPIPIPPVMPPCKHRITLKCDQDNLWGIYISDTHVCYAKTPAELIEKLNKLLDILD